MGAQAGAGFIRQGFAGSHKLAVWALAGCVLGSSLGPIVSGLCTAALAQESSSSSNKYIAPVDGPVIRRYEQPSGPYAKGHRGIDYGVAAGTTVKASNGGTVVFAGPVADDGLFVTLRHSDGLETLYSYLSRIDVARGAQVAKGHPIGLSGNGHPDRNVHALHFAVKENGEYVDPEMVLEGDSGDISDALALVPVQGREGGAEGSGRTTGGEGGYFADPPRGSGFTTGPDGETGGFHPRAGDGFRNGPTPGMTGSRSSARGPSPGTYWGPGGFPSDGSETHPSWQSKRDRIGRFLAGDQEPGSVSRQAAERARAEQERSSATKSPRSVPKRKGWAAFLRPGPFWGPVGGYIISHSHVFKAWSVKQMDRVATFLLSRWERFKLWLAKQTDRVGDFLQPPADQGLEAFLPGLASGIFHQIGCSLRGGDPPPKMPTAEQFRQGERKPPPAPSDNIVMVIGGLGSSSTQKNGKVTGHASLFDLDFRTLGFKEDQIYHYSYKGVEKRGGNDPYRIHAPYDKQDTHKEVMASARVLDGQIQEIHRRHPGKKVDLVAHSEGGLVASYFVSRIYDKSNPKHPQVSQLVTLNSPHQGADLARLGETFTETSTGRIVRPLAEGVLSRLVGAPPATAPVLHEVEEDSTFIEDLKKSHDPKKVQTTTIGTAGDWIVTAPHTSLPGSDHYTADLRGLTFSNFFKAHSQAATAPSTQGFIYNALAGRKSQCTAFRNSFARYVSGPAISTIEDGAIMGLQGQFYLTDAWASMGGSTVPASRGIATK